MKDAMRVLVAALLLTVPAPAVAQDIPADEAAIPRIGLADFKKALSAGQLIVLDVRDQSSYESGHIPGAILVPFWDLQKHASQLKASGKRVVTYCA
jgi:3-mercaptopyruvate sulfurtransferase SseA